MFFSPGTQVCQHGNKRFPFFCQTVLDLWRNLRIFRPNDQPIFLQSFE